MCYEKIIKHILSNTITPIKFFLYKNKYARRPEIINFDRIH